LAALGCWTAGVALCLTAFRVLAASGEGEDPVLYVGDRQPDKRFYDGLLPHAVGVHSVQVFRANRSQAPEGGLQGWTYNHAPMLAYWRGRFWLQYLSNPKEEHNAPGRTLITSSKDGYHWDPPRVAFPVIYLPEIEWRGYRIPQGTPAVMHQRMGFYVAPNGRLLTIGFYSYCPNPRVGPNNGQGIGRVVREIYPDGNFGPIYFIRYNRHAGWDESNTPWFPFYKTSPDSGFIAACDSLLANRLVRLQWWEMEQVYDDSFYTFIPPPGEVVKALCFFHRADGAVVALWKGQRSALSFDEGRTWTPLLRNSTLLDCNAKVWGQRTDDGRYALVYNHSATRRNRFPLVVITGEDGHRLSDMLCVVGEVPPVRYQGLHKNPGPQYIRGIVEGNGDPPGQHLWVTYSMSKEDIWVSRIHVPIAGVEQEKVEETFDGITMVGDLTRWNLYMPQWAPTEIAEDPEGRHGRVLRLVDEEPYDYAVAERVFPETDRAEVRFEVNLVSLGHANLEIEVQSQRGERPLKLRLDSEFLSVDIGKVENVEPIPIRTGCWYTVKLMIDCAQSKYRLELAGDGAAHRREVPFARPVKSVGRLVFRTGPWRGDVRLAVLDGEPGTPGIDQEDLPGADFKVAPSVFLIDDIVAGPS
jgi:hypothetical protein